MGREISSVKMAIAVWGVDRHYKWYEIRSSHFEQTARDCEPGSSVQAVIDELVERTPQVIEQVIAMLPVGFPDAVSASILERLKQAARRLGTRACPKVPAPPVRILE